MERLIFGDKKSIAIRNSFTNKNIIGKLKRTVKCPYCGAKVSDSYDFNMKEETISFNFRCKSSCPNSYYYGEKYGYDKIKTTFDFNGNLKK